MLPIPSEILPRPPMTLSNAAAARVRFTVLVVPSADALGLLYKGH